MTSKSERTIPTASAQREVKDIIIEQVHIYNFIIRNKKMKHMYIPLLFISLAACQSSNQTTMMVNPLKALNNDGRNEIIEVNNELPSFKKPGKPITITIPQNDMELAAEAIAEDYAFIPLETTDESLLGEINKIETDENFIFVFDQRHNKALQFDQNGKFIRAIGKRGRGPNEYVSIEDMSIDKTNKQICLLDNSGIKLLFYDYNGTCVKEEPQYFGLRNIEFAGNLRFAHVPAVRNEQIPAVDLHQLIVCDKEGIPLYCDFPISEAICSKFHWTVPHPLRNFYNGLYYCSILSDTIWRIEPKQIIPAFVLKFPDRKSSLFTPAEIENMDDELFERKQNNTTAFMGEEMVTEKFVYLPVTKKGGNISDIIYSKKTGKAIRFASMEKPNGGSRLGDYFLGTVSFKHVLQDSIFVCVFQPKYLKEQTENMTSAESYQKLQPKDRQMLEALKVEDNPVLMLVKLKDF